MLLLAVLLLLVLCAVLILVLILIHFFVFVLIIHLVVPPDNIAHNTREYSLPLYLRFILCFENNTT